MSGVLLQSRAPYPKENTQENWLQWAVDASDVILERFRELQKSNLLSDALYAGCMTVLYRIPVNAFPFGIPKEEIVLQDVVMASGYYLTAPVLRELVNMSPQFSRPDLDLANRIYRESSKRGIKPSTLVRSMGLSYQRVMPWLIIGNFLPPDVRNVIQEALNVRGLKWMHTKKWVQTQF